MTYYVKSIVDYVSRQMAGFTATATGNRRLQVMIPRLPCDATLQLSKLLEDLCFNNKIRLEFKVADALIQTWLPQEALELDAKYRAKGSLTGDRNDINNPEPVVQILIGSATVTDKGSLSDFHQCDKSVLWKVQLDSSFSSWLEACFEKAGITYEQSHLDHLDIILGELRARFELYQISELLDDARFTTQDAGEAEKELLSQLHRFNLPNLRSFKFGQKRRTFRYYVDGATDFFSYSLFLDTGKRLKALKSLAEFVRVNDGNIPQDKYDPFPDETSFLTTLKNYIENNVQNPLLQHCDFVYIFDTILKFVPKSEVPPGKTIKKLSGAPVEVILRALWFALGKCEFRKSIRKVKITGQVFRHDYLVEESAIAADSNDIARAALTRLLGGVDALCQQYIQLSPYKDGNELTIESNLLNDDLSFYPSKSAEPYFEFHVSIESDQPEPEVFAFALKLPETHPYRLAEGLIALAVESYEKMQGTWVLPAYHLAYYEELMIAKDEDEICRVLSHCVNECRPGDDAFMVNLFLDVWQRANDPFAQYLQKVCLSYREFIEDAHVNGLYTALHLGETVEIFQAYKEAAEAFTKKDNPVKNSVKLASMLMRAFLVLPDKRKSDATRWTVAKHEPSAIVTVLHPALLEMLQAQVAFLFSAFSTVATSEFNSKRPFKDSKWHYYADMSTIQMPLAGLLVDEDLKLDVNIVGKDLVHRLGDNSTQDASMATRLLVRYDGIEDDDVSDAEIFCITRESRLLHRFLEDFWYMHPQASDGISIGVYRNDDIQPILSAMHSYLRRLEEAGVLREDRAQKYFVRLILFSESTDETAIVNWLEQWQERWEAAETETSLRCYSHCQFSVSHRIVSPANDYRQFKESLDREIDCDIFILYNFIESGRAGNKFKVADEFNETNDTLKFPILEKSLCATSQPDEESRRAQIISNRQFRIGALHTEIMARLKSDNILQGVEHVILGYGDYEPWKKVVDAAHNAAEWVICIDPNIDEGLIAYTSSGDSRKRELIGFGSGVGSHGESNYTISTQKFFIADLKRILMESFKRIYKYGTQEDDTMITESLMQSARSLAGLSLIRALGPNEYIRDFVSYALMRKILPLSGNYVCDQLFSIDAYRHWFDMSSDDDKTHPDLLWLRAIITEGRKLKLEAKLFECKMAQQNQEHIDKAKTQIENGIQVLVNAFMPKNSAISDNRPDQRYWHLQLHRLIASRSKVNPEQEADFLSAMEKLAEGDFEITWDAAVFTFWTDSAEEGLAAYDSFDVNWDNTVLSVPIYSAGYKFLRELCAGNVAPLTEWSEKVHLEPQTRNVAPLAERKLVIPDIEETLLDEEEIDAGESTLPEEPPIVPAPTPSIPATALSQPMPLPNGTVITDSKVTATLTDIPTVQQTIPARILLGRSAMGQKDIYWEFGHPGLSNRHMLIFGSSGEGKTYAIQAILCELGNYSQNSLIVDYTNGFLKNQLQNTTIVKLQPTQHILKTEKLPISPFKRHVQKIDDDIFIPDNAIDVAKRVAATFKTVYAMGDQQFSILTDAIEEGVTKYQDSLTLDDVMSILHSYLEDQTHTKSTVQTTISKVKPFVSEKPFTSVSNDIGWQSLFADSIKRCHIFQLTMIDRISQQILTEFILWDLYAFVRSSGTEAHPKVVVLDEVQNLDHNLDAPVAKYLTEGRKFGLSLIAATQTLSNLDRDQQSRLFLASHKLFFRPSAPETAQYADYAMQAAGSGNRAEWIQKLSALQKGECFSIGPALNETTGKLESKVAKIKITSLEERNLNG
jgi:DNA phosphorothioation-dependent restriction protein DptH